MLFLLAFIGGLEGWAGRFEKRLCTYKNLSGLRRSICLKRPKGWGGSPWSPVYVPGVGTNGVGWSRGQAAPPGPWSPISKAAQGALEGPEGTIGP